MNVENNFAIPIAILSDLFQNLAPIFQPIRQDKNLAPCARDFFRDLSKLQAIARNSDWFIALFGAVVIGRRNWFGIGFSKVIISRLRLLRLVIGPKISPQFFNQREARPKPGTS